MTIKSILTNILIAIASILSIVGTFYIGIYLGDKFTGGGGGGNNIPSSSNDNTNSASSPPSGPLPDPLDNNKVCTDGTCKNKKVITPKRAADVDLNAQKPKVVRYVDKWTTHTVLAPPSPSDVAVPSGAQYCPFEEDINEDYNILGLYCFYDSPHTPATITAEDKDTNVSDDEISIPSANSGDFVSPVLQPGELTPIVWRESSKIVTQHAYQVGVPPELITSLLDYCKELGIIELMQKYTTNEPIEPKEKGHNGKFLNLTKTNNVGYNDTYQWYAQRPEKKWKSNMHWISPANEKSHEDYLRALSRGNFDKVLEGIGTALKLDSLVAYHLTFIGVSHAERGFAHHDTTTTKGGVYNVIIPLLLEDDGEPELLLWDFDPPNDSKKGKRGGYKYKIGAAAMMGDDAIHGTHECDYRNMSNAKHGGWIEDEDSIGTKKKRRSGMRLAATVYIAEVYDENVETVAERTLTQIFPVCDEKWLLTQEARHWQNPALGYYEVGNTMKNDTGRRAFRVDDEKTDCEERMEEGLCESDVEGTRKKCLFSCGVYIEEGVTRVEKKSDKKNDEVDVCTQNRTGLEECRSYQDNTEMHGDFISPNLSPGELFPFVWRNDAKQVTPYAFQIGVPPELVSSLLDYCDRLGITQTMRELVGDKPLEVDPDGERDDGSYNYYHEFLELKDGNDWFIQRPPSKWQSNMHWISPADEKTHEEYLKILAAGNFDKVLQGIGEYLGLESLVAYHLTFIGVSHSEKGFIHRDTHHTGASVYNVIIPLILEDDAEPELAMQDWDDESRYGTLKYKVGMAAMMGDDAMHGTQACDYREKKGMRLAATVYIADIHSLVAARRIATQTLTQIFPMPDADWLLAQSGRHWKSDDDETSLVNDKGREPFSFHDKLSDCTDRADKDMCASDQHTRSMCLKSCKIYQSSDSEDDDDDYNNVVHYEDYQNFYEVGQYINAFFDNIVEDEDCEDASDECEQKAKAGMCMSAPEQMDRLGCHRSCLYCLTSDSRDLFSLGVDQVLIEDDSEDDDSEDDFEEKEVEESDVLAVMAKTEQYFINEVLVKDDLRRYRLSCKNMNKNCAVWAAQGHCEVSSSESGFMYKDCPAACQECPLLDPALRCPIDESTNIFKPGDMNAMFERWLIESGQDLSSFNEKTLSNRKFAHPFGDITVITSPYHDAAPYIEELEEEDQDDNDELPWLVSIDNFLTDEECERLIELGGVMGYKRSTKYSDDETNLDGTAKFVTEDSRTSYNAWCYEGCDDDPIVRGVINRMEKMTGVPYSNYENLQLVRYTEGQQYKEHHDWTSTHEKHPYGGRILTFFLYLNDVEAGGGTKFNYLNFTATPKKGGAIVWPSMTDDMKEQNDWTWHQALPVEKGIKYGANAWLHIRNYQDVPDHC